jgi:hypothetical protein
MLSSAAATESILNELPWLLESLHIISPKYASELTVTEGKRYKGLIFSSINVAFMTIMDSWLGSWDELFTIFCQQQNT